MKVVISNQREYVKFINENVKVKRRDLGKLDMDFYRALVRNNAKHERGQKFKVKVTNCDNCRRSNIARFEVVTVKNNRIFVKFRGQNRKEFTGYEKFLREFVRSKRLNSN